MDEIWVPVPGFEKGYEIDIHGQVRTKPRDILGPTGRLITSLEPKLIPIHIDSKTHNKYVLLNRDNRYHKCFVSDITELLDPKMFESEELKL